MIDFQMTVQDSSANGNHRTTKYGKDFGTLTVCFHGLHQNSTEGFWLNWQ